MSESLPIVVRGQGITPKERYLQALCDRSFLSLWSYPAIFRDQNKRGAGDGKEVCDLLVVFGDDILIFSDKSCAFPNTGDAKLDWSRWFRKAVLDSARQAWGAERWIREYPERLFIDRACTQRFPLSLPTVHHMKFHHIVVAHNVLERSRSHFGGGSGTLVFNSDLTVDDQQNRDACEPFAIGWLDRTRSFVHVLDDASLEMLLSARDTITDFVEYLRAKERFLGTLDGWGTRLFCAGEEELVAHYLLTMRDGEHAFDVPEGFDSVAFDEGGWEYFINSPQRAAQLKADLISYAWDGLIEKFNSNILGGTSYYVTDPRISEREKIMRFFAREPRVRRRLLGEALVELVGQAKPGQRANRIVFPSRAGDPHYCFLVLPPATSYSYEKYREARRKLLEMCCYVTKLVAPDALDVIGLATENDVDRSNRSEDALYLDMRAWSTEMQAQARAWQKEFNLLTNVTRFESRIAEFPIPIPDGV